MHWPTWRDLPGAVIDLQRRRFRRLSRGCLARAGETPLRRRPGRRRYSIAAKRQHMKARRASTG